MGAPLNPVPNVLRVVLRGFVDTSSASTIWENVLHFQFGGTPPSDATCQAIGSTIGNGWAGAMAPECPAPTSLQIVTVTDLSSPSAGSGEAAVLHPGTRGDDPIPGNAAFLISYPSTVRYKGGHPRNYLYVLGVSDLQSGSTWHSAAVAEVQSHWQQFLTNCLSAGTAGTTISGFCSISYRSKFAPNGGPPHYYRTVPLVNPISVASAVGNTQLASQRGRIGRRRD